MFTPSASSMRPRINWPRLLSGPNFAEAVKCRFAIERQSHAPLAVLGVAPESGHSRAATTEVLIGDRSQTRLAALRERDAQRQASSPASGHRKQAEAGLSVVSGNLFPCGSVTVKQRVVRSFCFAHGDRSTPLGKWADTATGMPPQSSDTCAVVVETSRAHRAARSPID